MKKTLALILSVLMVLSAVSTLSVVSFADETEGYTIADGVLTVTADVAAGEGNSYPWTAEKDTITKVVVTSTVTTIDHHAFSDFNELVEVVIEEGVTTIKADAFSYCEKLTTITIPATVTYIGQGTVWGTGNIATVNGGWKTAEEFKAVWNVIVYNDNYEKATYVSTYVAPETITLAGAKWAEGMENWENSPNKGDLGSATQILLGMVPTEEANADTLKALWGARADYTWTLKISTNADMSDAVTKVMQPATFLGHYTNVYFRFEPCLAEGDNQWIPTKDTVYFIELTVEGTDVVYHVASQADGFKLVGVDPVVPAPESETTAITIEPKFGAWENWVNSPNKGDMESVTQLLVGISINGISKDLTWKLTIAAGEESKTITMAPATTAEAYNLYRFETCLGAGENQFVPVKDTDYTVTIEVFDGENCLYKSEPTSGFVCPMDPVVPAPVVPDEPDEPQGPTYKVNGTVLTVLADVVGEGAGENRVFPWSDIKDTITKVVVAKGVTKIDQRAFTKFANLEEVVIADTVTEIGADAFSYNSKLTTLTIPTSVTTIGQGIVYSSSAITTVYGGWESADAFKAVWDVKPYNTSFEAAELKTYEDYTLVDGVLTLYKDIEAATEDAYPWAADKDSIKKIIIWDTVSVVGARAFSNCKNLEEVVVGNGVLVLKQDAFSYCSKLATITIPSTVGEIGQGIVYSSTGITTVYGGWETAEEFKAIWSVKNYNTAFEGEGVEYLVIGTVKEPVVTPPVPGGDDQKPGDNDQKPGDNDQKPGDNDQKPGTDDEQTGDTTTDTEEGGFPTWAIAVIVIAVVAVAAGVVVVLKKKKD